ncbi:MAG: hypothetical protein ACRELC_06110 [Gemmatimonadota bacterium]
MPEADVVARHETIVRAPAGLVLEVAQGLELESVPWIRAIFWLRAKLLGGVRASDDRPKGLLEATTSLGWGVLARRPERELVVGAVTRAWEADPTFTPIPTDRFAAFSEPGLVKIVWTLEAEPLGRTLEENWRVGPRVLVPWLESGSSGGGQNDVGPPAGG